MSNKARILIVDDVGVMRKFIAKACHQLGFVDILEAEDGEEAWKILTQANPPIDVVLSDWIMPKCDGMELLLKIRQSSEFKSLPFIMVTTDVDKSNIGKALKAGASNFLIKPVTVENMSEKLKALKLL